MRQIKFPKVTTDVYSLCDNEVEDLGNIEFKEIYNKDIDFPFDDVINMLCHPNVSIGTSDTWYLNVGVHDVILIKFSRTKPFGHYKKITISTNNYENEDLKLILNYFLFLSKGYSKMLEEKSNRQLLKIIEYYFNNDVWRDFVFDTDNETELPYNEVLREFLIDKILLDVSLHELINDGFNKIDY